MNVNPFVYIFANLILSGLVVASIAVIWRNALHDLPRLHAVVKKLPWVFSKALYCGFCFTYWVALVYVIVFKPLAGWLPQVRLSLPATLFPPLEFLLSWMAVGMVAVIIRFAYVVLQELVHYQVHKMNATNEPEHHH